jgi:chromosome segregation ATPase
MRKKILQLKRIRELRAQQKKGEFLQARAQHQQAEAAMDELRREYWGVQRAIKDLNAAMTRPGGMTAADIERRLNNISRLEGYLNSMVPRVKAVDQMRKNAKAAVDAAQAAQRDAERAVEQMTTVDKRMEAQEIAEAERLEEMMEEPRTKPPMGGGGPASDEP